MNRFDDHDPTPPDLELSQEELDSLFHDAGQELVLHGEPVSYSGMYSAEVKGREPFAFKLMLPSSLIREVYYDQDDDMIAHQGEATYIGPYLIEPDDDVVFQSVTIHFPGQLVGTDVKYLQWLNIICEDGRYSATVDVQYSRGGKAISPNDFSGGKGLSDERVMQILEDAAALERPAVLDDAEKLRQIIDFIAGRR